MRMVMLKEMILEILINIKVLIVRHKSPWTWNGIDSETLSGNTISKGSDKPFEIKTKISDKSEYVSKSYTKYQ